MSPYKDLGEVFDDIARFGNDWVDRYVQKWLIEQCEDIDSSYGE